MLFNEDNLNKKKKLKLFNILHYLHTKARNQGTYLYFVISF